MTKLIEIFFWRPKTKSRLTMGQFEVPAEWSAKDMVDFYETMNADLLKDGTWFFEYKVLEWKQDA